MKIDINIMMPPRHHLKLQGLRAMQKAGKSSGEEQASLRQAAQEFESLLIEHMIKEMRKSVPESPIFGREPGREIFNEFLDGEYSRLMTQRGGIGLTDFLLNSMNRNGDEKGGQ